MPSPQPAICQRICFCARVLRCAAHRAMALACHAEQKVGLESSYWLAVQSWFAKVAPAVKKNAPMQLVTTGIDGFYQASNCASNTYVAPQAHSGCYACVCRSIVSCPGCV